MRNQRFPIWPLTTRVFWRSQRQFVRIARLLLRSHVLWVLLGGTAQVLLAAQRLALQVKLAALRVKVILINARRIDE